MSTELTTAADAPPPVAAVQTQDYEMHGDLSRMGADLAKVSMSLGPIKAGDVGNVKTKTGPGYKYTYAGLPTVVSALLPILAEHEIGLVQIPLANAKGGGVVTHVLGQGWRISATLFLPMGAGSPQAIGSMQTYARRYSLLGIFSLAPDDDDGSGDRAEEAHRKQRGQQVARQDSANGRGAQAPNPKVILEAFAKHSVSEAALVAQLQGTPVGKVNASQLGDLRKLLVRLNGGEAVEDVLGADAMDVIMEGSALGERKRVIETKAAVHKDAQSQATLIDNEPDRPYSPDDEPF